MHPISSKSGLINAVKDRKVLFSDHYAQDVEPVRDIETEEIQEILKQDISSLLAFSYKPDDYTGERYNICFEKSTSKYLVIAISFKNGHIIVVTAFPVEQFRGEPEELVNRFG